jgi:hypothetical protein
VRRQRQPQERLGRDAIAFGREQKVDGFVGRIDRPVKAGPFSGDANVGFIHPPRSDGTPQFAPNPLIQNRCLALHPSPIVTCSTDRPRSAMISSRSR